VACTLQDMFWGLGQKSGIGTPRCLGDFCHWEIYCGRRGNPKQDEVCCARVAAENVIVIIIKFSDEYSLYKGRRINEQGSWY